MSKHTYVCSKPGTPKTRSITLTDSEYETMLSILLTVNDNFDYEKKNRFCFSNCEFIFSNDGAEITNFMTLLNAFRNSSLKKGA